MSFRAGVVDYLTSQPGVTQLVGARVHPSVLPDKSALPAIVYRVVTNTREVDYEGPVELAMPRLQLDVYAKRMSEAEAVQEAVEGALLGYRGPMGDVEYTAGWRLELTTDLYEEESRLHRILMDFRGWYGAPQEVS